MSILPNASTAAFTSASGASDLVRSPANTAVSPWISPDACSATSPSRSLIRTCAPSETSSSAVARPIPRAEPVTMADLPSSTPIAVASPCSGWETLVIYGRPGSPPASWIRAGRSAGDDDAEVLRVDATALVARQRARQARGDADGGVAEVRVEDVGAVARRGHPGGDDRAGSGVRERAPADVLADFVADVRAVDVSGGAHAHDGRFALRADVFEVVLGDHAVGVSLGEPSELQAYDERTLPLSESFASE